MAARNTRYPYDRNRTSYIEGNAVRKFSAIPDTRMPEPRRVPREQPRRRTQRQPRSLTGMSMGALLVLILAVTATVYACVDYLKLHSEVSVLEKNTLTLEKTLSSLRDKNDAVYNQINKEYDLGYVYQVAVEELGMVYPDKNVVVKYESTDGSYVRQYKDIPD